MIPGLASIIIPCWNQLEFTRHCVTALVDCTPPPWELILIDNGSTDGTANYLAGVQDASPRPVTVIANATNRGFPAAINQGLKCARGEYLVLLNNDAVVTDGWLGQLIGLASTPVTTERLERTCATPTIGIGMVGPMSNYAAPPQLVAEAPYHDMGEMHVFARQWREEHRGKWFNVPKLSGFCLLMKRTVYDAIGGLDEQFGLGFFDDDDLGERARRAGFELAVANDLFVHHFGSRTFVGNGVDAERVLDENATKFAAKWGNSVPKGRRVALRAWKPGDTGLRGEVEKRENGVDSQVMPSDADGDRSRAGVRLEIKSRPRTSGRREVSSGPLEPIVGLKPVLQSAVRGRVSLTMIVRDEQYNLPRCLASVRGVFDEIVVVDTGSRDRTVEIAREFGARVSHFAWIDDFGAARNAALAQARGDYAFWLDADDLLELEERTKLEELLGQVRDSGWRRATAPTRNGTGRLRRPDAVMPSAYVVRCACDPGPGGIGGNTMVDHIRLFPLFEGARWTYKVHEQILPAMKRAGVPVEWTEIIVRHTGYTDRALRARKLERDSRILHNELAERPDDPFTLFNLGSIAIERAQWTESLEYLERSLAGSAPTDSITRKLYALIARADQMLGDFPAALRSCALGLALDPEDAELWFRKAVVHLHGGDPGEAERCWRLILTLSRPQKFASIDQGIYGHLTRRNLAALAKQRGDLEEARRQWQAVLAECPGDAEATAQLGQLERGS